RRPKRIAPAPSEALRDSGDLERMRLVTSGLFSAQPGAGKYFVGVGKLERVESAADELHGLEVRLAVHLRHHLLFLFTHAVFPGDGAACLDTQFEDAKGELLRSVLLSRDAAVV